MLCNSMSNLWVFFLIFDFFFCFTFSGTLTKNIIKIKKKKLNLIIN